MMIRLRNNSDSIRNLPPVGDVNGKIPGPSDSIVLVPGSVTLVDSERLKLYDSPAFNAAFDEGADGSRPALEILPPEGDTKSMADVLAMYEQATPAAPVAPPAPVQTLADIVK